MGQLMLQRPKVSEDSRSVVDSLREQGDSDQGEVGEDRRRDGEKVGIDGGEPESLEPEL
jgi:hypothetical protein